MTGSCSWAFQASRRAIPRRSSTPRSRTVEAHLPYFRLFRAQYRFIGRGGEVLHTATGRNATYRLRGDEPYVRVEATSADGSILWTQPLLATDAFELPV